MNKEKLQIRCVVNSKCDLGEGPVWNRREQSLYWVDIYANKIYCYNPENDTTMSWITPEHIAFVIFTNDNRLVGGLKSGLHQLQLNSDGSLSASRIDRVDESSEHIRFNDATGDIDGGVWACTMDIRAKEALGKYFYYDNQFRRTIIDEGYVVGNGPALSSDERLLYTVETVGSEDQPKGVYAFDVTSSKKPENKRLLIKWEEQNTYPDGVITDASGNLWIGVFGGNALRCFAPDGKMKAEILLPAWNITKPVFGNDRQDIMYVTSARLGVDEKTLTEYPLTGGIFEIRFEPVY